MDNLTNILHENYNIKLNNNILGLCTICQQKTDTSCNVRNYQCTYLYFNNSGNYCLENWGTNKYVLKLLYQWVPLWNSFLKSVSSYQNVIFFFNFLKIEYVFNSHF